MTGSGSAGRGRRCRRLAAAPHAPAVLPRRCSGLLPASPGAGGRASYRSAARSGTPAGRCRPARAGTTLPLGFLWAHRGGGRRDRRAASRALARGLPRADRRGRWSRSSSPCYRLGRRGPQLLAGGAAPLPFLVLALAVAARRWPRRPGRRPGRAAGRARPRRRRWAGAARRARSEAARARRGPSRSIAGTLLEHTARGERARISRELHDVVAHHISMIAVQAETARLTTPGMPAAGAQRLSAIGDTARAR